MRAEASKRRSTRLPRETPRERLRGLRPNRITALGIVTTADNRAARTQGSFPFVTQAMTFAQ